MKALIRHNKNHEHPKQCLVGLVLEARDMFQCGKCGQGKQVSDCVLEAEYRPENRNPPYEAQILCPDCGSWLAYCSLERLTFERAAYPNAVEHEQ